MDEEHIKSLWVRTSDTDHLTREIMQMRPCLYRQIGTASHPPPLIITEDFPARQWNRSS